jgi:hypothetical protein
MSGAGARVGELLGGKRIKASVPLAQQVRMASTQRISTRSDIPVGRTYVLIQAGDKDELTRDGDNYVVTVDRCMLDNLFEAHLQTAISDAELLANQERLDSVFVCVAPRDKA